MIILMIIIYSIFLIAAALFFAPVIAAAFVIQPKFRAGFFQKLGFYRAKNAGGKTAVFHAVSVGETNAVKELIMRYKKLHPEENIIVTSATRTGHALAEKVFSGIAEAVYFPYDFFFSVLLFFNTYKPEKVIIAETEIWPCFAAIAKKRGIKIYIINGRISPHSYKGYKRIKMFIAPVLNCFEKIMMQSSEDAERIIDIGAQPCRTEVMGNLKFDIEKSSAQKEIQKYKSGLKTDKHRIFIAASTHKGEDEIIISAFKALKEKYSDAGLLIAPRHPERFDEVYELLKHEGLKPGRSSLKAGFDSCDAVLLDEMGVLSKLFSICYAAFIGGSFSKTGGHNPLEALIWEKPVISGSCVFNFKDVYKIVCAENCAVIVNTAQELTDELISFYEDKKKYEAFCKNASAVFDKNRGALDYALKRI